MKVTRRIAPMNTSRPVSPDRYAIRGLIFALCFLASGFSAFAATKTSTTTGGVWNATTTWVGGVVPIANDDVIIADGATVTVNVSTVSLTSLTVGQGTSGILNFNTAGAGTFVTGTTTVATGGQLLNSTVATATRQFGTLVVNGTWNCSVASPISISGALTVNTGATFTAGAGLYTLAGAAQTIGGTISALTIPNLTISAASVYTNSIPSLTIGTALSGNGALTMGANTTLTLTGANTIVTLNCTANTPNTVVYNGATPTVKGNMTYNNLIMSTSGAAPLGATATVIGGDLSITSGSLTIGTTLTLSVTGSTTIAGGATLTYGSTGAGTFTGDFTNNGTWTNSAVAALNFAGNVTNNNVFTASTGVYTFSGTGKTISGTTLTIPNVAVTGTITNNVTTLTVSTALSGAGTLTMGTGSTLRLTGTTTTAISITTLNCTANTPNTVIYNGAAPTIKATTYYNLTSNTTGIALCATPGITVNNDLSVLTGTLNDGGFQIVGNGTGALSVANAAFLQIGNAGATIEAFPTLYPTANITLGATSTVTYNSTGAQTIAASVAGIGPASYGNLTTVSTSIKTIGGNAVVANNFTNGAGTTFTLGGNSLSIAGTYTNSGTLSANIAGSEIILTGGTAITFTIGATTPVTGQLQNLTISKSTGIIVTLGGAVQVNNNLTIASGTLATGTLGLIAVNTDVSGILSINGATAAKALGAVTINSGGAVNSTVAATITSTSLNIQSGGTWSTATGIALVTITGDLINAGTFTNAVASTYTISGNITNDGTFTSGAGLYTLNGAAKTFNTTNGSALTLTNVTINGSGTYTIPVVFTDANRLSVTGTLTMVLAGNALVNNGNLSVGTATLTLGTVTNNDSMYVATAMTGGGTFINAATGTFLFAGPSIALSSFNISSTGNTVVYNSATAAQTVRSSTSYYNLTIAIGSAFTASLNGATPIRNDLSVLSGTFSDGGASNQIGSNATGTLTVAAGAALQIGAGGTTTTVFPAFATANVILSPTSTVIYNTTSAVTISAIPATYGNLTLSGASIKTAGTAHTLQGNLTINAGTFADAGNVITVNGNILNSAIHTSTGAGKIYLTGGSAAHTLSSAATGTYGNLELDDAPGANLTSNATITNTLSLTSGTFAAGTATLTLNGPAIAGTGTNLTTTTGTVLAFGPNTNANAGLYIPSSVSNLSSLALNIAVGNKVATNSEITLNLAGAALTMTQGLLDIGANNIIVAAPAGTATGAANGFVIANPATGGQLMKVFPAATATTFTFPIGDNVGTNEYSPVTLNTFTAAGGAKTIGASVTDAAHPQVNSNQTQTNYVTRYWTFTESGAATSYTYNSIALTYINSVSDVAGTVSTANDQINRYDGAWSTLTSTIAAPTATSSAATNTSGTLGGNDYTIRLDAPKTYTWNNNAGGPWTTATNWTPVRNNPANSDVLIFDGTVTPSLVTVTAVPTQTIGQLQVINSADASLQSATTATILTCGFSASANVLTIDATSTLELSSTGTNVLTIAFPALTALSTDIEGTIAINANTGLTNTLNFTNLLAANNTIAGTISNNGGAVTATAATTLFGAGSVYIHNRNGGVVPTATWHATSTLSVTGIIATNATGLAGTFGHLVWNNPAQTATGAITGIITLAGNLTVSGGTLNFASFAVNVAGDVSNIGTINTGTAGAALVLNGTTVQTVSGTGTWTTGTTGRLLNLTTNNAAGVTFTPAIAVQTGLNLTAGTLTASSLTIGVPATAVTTTRGTGSLANVPSFNYTSGIYTLIYNGLSTTYTSLNELPPSTTPTNGPITVSLSTSNVVLDKDASITALTTSVAGATFNLNGNTLSLSATPPINNTGTITANATNSTIRLNGSTASQSLVTSAGVYTGSLVSDLIIDNSNAAGVTLGAQSASLNFGDVTINAGRLLNLNAATIRIAGLYTNNGTLTGNAAGSTISMTGSSPQTFTVGTYAGSILTNFIINNPSGVTLGSPLNVSGILTLTNGTLTTTNTNLISVTNTAVAGIAGGSAASYVNGPLSRNLPASSSAVATYAFPIGKSDYNLFEMVNPTTGTGTITVKAEVQDALTGGTDGLGFSSAPNPVRYWQTTVTGNLISGGTVRVLDAAMSMTADNVIGASPTLTGAYVSLGNAAINTPATGNILSASVAPNTSCFIKVGTKGCLSGTYTIGATGADFTTLTTAVNMLNASYVCSDLIFELTSTYAGTTEVFPISINPVAYTGGPWNVTFRPGAGVIKSTIGTPGSAVNFINLNGADYITFDGRAGGIGSISAWTMRNAQTAATFSPVVQFINDATNDTLKYLTLESQNTNAASGTILIGTTTGSTGNDNIFIDNNTIRDRSDAAGYPVNAIYAAGTAARLNDNITISNNKIFNFWSAGAGSNGVNLQANNSDYTITGNSFYQTASRTQTAAGPQTGIQISSTAGGNFTITDNYIGGTAPNAAGSAWTIAGSFANIFAGISLNTGNATSSIQNNTVNNINLTCANNSAGQPGIFAGIYVSLNSSATIGDITGNTIGSTSGTGGITITNATTGATVNGICYTATGGPINIQNNKIGSITVQGSSVAVSNHFNGIYFGPGLSTAPAKIVSNNMIGSTSTANSINLITASTNTTAQNLYGIAYTSGTSTGMIMQNNTIANLNNNYAGATASSTIGINITNSSTAFTVTGNTVYNLTTTIPTTGITSAASLIGICAVAATTGHNVSNNIVYGLSNTTPTAAVTVTGIYYGPAAGGSNTINANLVHSLSASSTSSIVNGLYINAGAATVSNNMIRLGINSAGSSITTNEQINGIYDANTTNNIWHNSVYIGGTGVSSGSSSTYAYYGVPASGTRAIQNNILWNARTNSGSSGKHYALRIGAMTGLTCNYNDLISTGPLGATAAIDYATLSAWQLQSGTPDLASITGNPQFINPTGNAAAVDLHISTSIPTPIEATGIAIGAVSADYDGQSRAGFTPTDMGADADNFISIDITPPAISPVTISNVCNNSNTYTISGVTITDATGVDVSATNKPRLYYKKTTAANTIAGWSYVQTSGSSSPFSFDIDFTAVGGIAPGDVIQYFLVAQDIAPAANVAVTGSGTFSTAPSAVVLGSSAFPIGGTLSTFTILPCQGTVNVGSTEVYPGITPNGGIFQAINALPTGLTGDLTISITSDIAVENGVNALTNAKLNGYKVRIVPSAAAQRTISNVSAITVPMIPINGATNVTFDGSFAGTGGFLRFRNTHTTATSATAVIQFYGSASADTLKNLILESNASSLATGVVYISTGTNTGIVLSGNTITSPTAGTTGPPANGVVSNLITNTACTLIGNNFENCTNTGVYLGPATGSGWIITQNNFYQSIPSALTQTCIAIYGGNGHTITRNVIGGSAAGATGTWINSGAVAVYPIYLSLASTGIPSIVDSNVIKNFSLTSTGASSFSGILGSTGSYILGTGYGNTISNITTAGTGITTGISSGTGTTPATMSRNIVFAIVNTNTAATTVRGIFLNGTSTSNIINLNTVYNLVSASNASSVITGIEMGGAGTVANNMIHLGYDGTAAAITNTSIISGISKTTANNTNFWHNTIYIGGTGVGTTANNTAAFRRIGAAVDDIRNNIFVNARSNAGSGGLHYAYILNANTTATSDYNVVYAPGTGGTLFSINGGTTPINTLQSWNFNTTFDIHSGAGNPNFVSAIATTPDLHIASPSPIEGAGINIATITEDYDGDIRASNTPVDIGADAVNVTAIDIIRPAISFSGLSSLTTSCGGGVSATVTATITDAGTGVSAATLWYRRSFPSATTWLYFTGSLTSGTPANGTWSFSVSIPGAVNFEAYQFYFVAGDGAPTPNLGYAPYDATSPVHTSVTTQVTAPGSPYTVPTSIGSPLSGSVTVGSGGNYSTFNGAAGLFSAINNFGLSSNLTVTVISDITETTNTPLNQISSPCGGGPYAILIQPDGVTKRTITGSISGSTGLIAFNGADSVTVDGQFAGDGLQHLHFKNTATNYNGTGYNSTFYWYNDATYNKIKNTIVEGLAKGQTSGVLTSGVIMLGTGSSAGNSYNTFDKNLITGTLSGGGADASTCLLFSLGTPAAPNANNTVINNEFKDFSVWNSQMANNTYGATNNRCYGLHVTPTGNGGNWTVTGNSFYTTFPENQGTFTALSFQPGASSTGNTISGNYIGGSAAQCGMGPGAFKTMGSTYSISNAEVRYEGIVVNAGTAAITDNTIKRIYISSTYYSGFVGIDVQGATNATIARNTIGGSINAAFNNTQNTVGTDIIQVNGGGNTGSSYPGYIYGLWTGGSVSMVCDSNNFNIMLQAGAYTGGTVQCILHQSSGSFVITNNTNSTYFQQCAGIDFNAFAIRIDPAGSSSGNRIENNKLSTVKVSIADISQANSTAVYVNIGSGGQAYTVNGVIKGNQIHDNTNVENSGFNEGIILSGNTNGNGTWDISNNMIYMNNGGGTNRMSLYGIDVEMNSASTTTVSYNSIWIAGSHNTNTGVANDCYALIRYPNSTDVFTAKNNILINTRSGGNGATFFGTISNHAGPTGFTSDYNFFMNNSAASGGRNIFGYYNTAGYARFNGATPNWQFSTGQDAHSFNATYNATTTNFTTGTLNPADLFVSAATGDLHIAYANGTSAYQYVDARATTLPVVIDYDGEARDISTPDIGADEFNTCSRIVITAHPAAQTICAGSNAKFGVKNTGGSPYTYQWQLSADHGATWNPLTISSPYTTNAAGDTLTITGATTALDSNLYRVKISNLCGDSTSLGALVHIRPAPQVTWESPASHVNNVCAGSVTLFGVKGLDATSFQWQVSPDSGTTWSNVANGAPYSLSQYSDTSYLSINTISTLNGKTYRCIVSNACGADTSGLGSLLVQSVPLDTLAPGTLSICAGGSGTFITGGTGVAAWSWQYYNGSSWSTVSNGTPANVSYSNTNTSTLLVTSTGAAVPGNYLYRAQLSSLCGTAYSDTAILNIMNGTTNAYLATVSDSLLVETCPDGPWTYYSTISEPNHWLFAIKKNGNGFSATPTLSMHFTAPTAYDSVENAAASKALFTMNRRWNVTIDAGILDSTVGTVSVRFFYNPADTLTMMNAAKAWALSHPTSLSGYTTKAHNVEWFKTRGIQYLPSNNTVSSVPTAYTFAQSAYTYGILNNVNYVELNNITSFSGGTAAIRVAPTEGAPIALPVTLLYVTASPVDDKYIRVDWATASEVNNSGFDVERSTDGISFSQIGWVDGHGNVNTTQLYTLPDYNVSPDVIYYYRLRQVDVDGRSTYSEIVSASISREGLTIGELIPNPSSTSTRVNMYSSTALSAMMQVYNATGQIVRTVEQTIYPGANFVEFNVADLSSGIYMVNIHVGDQRTSRRLVVR